MPSSIASNIPSRRRDTPWTRHKASYQRDLQAFDPVSPIGASELTGVASSRRRCRKWPVCTEEIQPRISVNGRALEQVLGSGFPQTRNGQQPRHAVPANPAAAEDCRKRVRSGRAWRAGRVANAKALISRADTFIDEDAKRALGLRANDLGSGQQGFSPIARLGIHNIDRWAQETQ